jgi:hypothetical protein
MSKRARFDGEEWWEMQRIHDLGGLLEFAVLNPGVARELKRDPHRVADMMGVKLTDEEAARVSENLDIDAVLETAEAADSMAAKVAQGIGLERFGRESS